jgi:flavin-binding protein dodecin
MATLFGGSIRFSTAVFRSGEYPKSSSYPAHLINRGKVERRTTSLTQGGTSPESWDKAAAVAIERASGTLRDLRVAEVTEQDVVIENGKVSLYRTKLKVSLKLEE